jgi:hypothetical protein
MRQMRSVRPWQRTRKVKATIKSIANESSRLDGGMLEAQAGEDGRVGREGETVGREWQGAREGLSARKRRLRWLLKPPYPARPEVWGGPNWY